MILFSRHVIHSTKNDVTWRMVYRVFFLGLKNLCPIFVCRNLKKNLNNLNAFTKNLGFFQPICQPPVISDAAAVHKHF